MTTEAEEAERQAEVRDALRRQLKRLSLAELLAQREVARLLYREAQAALRVAEDRFWVLCTEVQTRLDDEEREAGEGG